MSKMSFLLVFILSLASYINGYLSSQFDQRDSFELIFFIINCLQLSAIWYVFSFFVQRSFFDKYPNKKDQLYYQVYIVITSLIIAVSIALIIKVSSKFVAIYVFSNEAVINWLHYSIYATTGLIDGSLLLTLRLSFLMAQQLSHEKSKRLKQEKEHNQAKLLALQARVEPHFLFNSLNTLYSLIYNDQKLAADYLLCFSEYIRTSFTDGTDLVADIDNEVASTKNYQKLLQTRFNHGLVIEHFDLRTVKYMKNIKSKIPSLSLTELIENAIKHNNIDADIPLKISIILTDGNIEVRNNINKKLNVNSNSLGLENLKQRVYLLTGKNLVIKETAEHFTVKMPLVQEKQKIHYTRGVNTIA